MKRATGFYWIRKGHKWQIAEWDNDCQYWLLTGIGADNEGDTYEFSDSDFDEIDETQLIR